MTSQDAYVPMALRSRGFAEKIRAALKDAGTTDGVADAVAGALRDSFKKDLDKLIKEASKAKAPKKGKAGKEDQNGTEEAADDAEQKQAILLGVAEFEHLTRICREVALDVSEPASARLALLQRLKSEQSNLQRMVLDCGLESALFGRMVTSDVLASRDAAVYVAHAFTVHEAQVENDYFTVVDDLLREAGEQSSAGIFDTELASGLYYGYVVVDVPQLVANLEGVKMKDWASASADKRELAGRVLQHLLHLIATVSPGAKRGSTAPFEWAKFMLVEAGDWQPRSLAGAFHNALPTNEPAIRKAAVQRLSNELSQLDAAYGAPLARRYLAVDDVVVPGAQRLPLKALAEWTQAAVTQARVEV